MKVTILSNSFGAEFYLCSCWICSSSKKSRRCCFFCNLMIVRLWLRTEGTYHFFCAVHWNKISLHHICCGWATEYTRKPLYKWLKDPRTHSQSYLPGIQDNSKIYTQTWSSESLKEETQGLDRNWIWNLISRFEPPIVLIRQALT